jgi:hypothetical protein
MPEPAGPPLFSYQGDYAATLRLIQADLLPRTYLEIGVATGSSISHVQPETVAVGIDPNPRVNRPLSERTRIFAQRSDDFFADVDVRGLFDGKPIDIGFIDGMHHYEFAFRDFRNVERHSAPGSIILIHDCLPPSRDSALREPAVRTWAGDVWKLILCLVDQRPDLDVHVVSAWPTGIGVVSNLDPANDILWEREQECIDDYLPLEFSAFSDRAPVAVRVVPNEWAAVRRLLPAQPYQHRSVGSQLRRARAHLSVTKAARALRLRLPSR